MMSPENEREKNMFSMGILDPDISQPDCLSVESYGPGVAYGHPTRNMTEFLVRGYMNPYVRGGMTIP